jgi:hypothetical protein
MCAFAEQETVAKPEHALCLAEAAPRSRPVPASADRGELLVFDIAA